MAPRKLAAGNWKMNGDLAALSQIDALITARPDPGCDVLICPPATLLSRAAEADHRGQPGGNGGLDLAPRAKTRMGQCFLNTIGQENLCLDQSLTECANESL